MKQKLRRWTWCRRGYTCRLMGTVIPENIAGERGWCYVSERTLSSQEKHGESHTPEGG